MILLLACALAVACVASLLIGSGSFGDGQAWAYLELRGLRTAAAALAGAALAVAGVLVQALFRNPLAEPGVIGVAAGAHLAIQIALVAAAGGMLAVPPDLLAPWAGLLGSGVALAALLAYARGGDSARVLLAGVALSLLLGAGGALVLALVQDDWSLARALIGFGFGQIAGTGPAAIAAAAPLIIAGLIAAWWWSRPLDLLLSGSDEAQALGLDARRAMRAVVVWSAALTAGAVALAGNLVFVGLLVPHLLRRVIGAGHRRLVPAAALGGAAAVVAADAACRCWPGQGELPLGAVTALLGAPLFLWLLVRGDRP